MKKAFYGYYRPSDDEFAELWATARIVVDANVLLAVYGLSPSTRDVLLGLLDRVRDRVWIPSQFAFEYQRNRIGKIREQVKHYEDVHRSLQAILEHNFRSKTQHPFVSEEVERRLEEICTCLLEGKRQQESLLDVDPHFARVTDIFADRVGPAYTEVELEKFYETARARFDKNIPPGFKDSQKPVPERYGDFVGWRQILDFATKNRVSVILVTDDAKEDWWRMEGTKNYGPRPELIVEFKNCCAGQFYMYSSDQFLEHSGRYIAGPVDPRAIIELKERRESESPKEVAKATIAPPSDQVIVKSAPPVSSTADEAPAPDTPKLTAPVVEKPEAE